MRTKGRVQQGGWGTSWWFGTVLCGLAALLLDSLQAGWAEDPPCPTPLAALDLSWRQAREEAGEEIRKQQLAVRWSQL